MRRAGLSLFAVVCACAGVSASTLEIGPCTNIRVAPGTPVWSAPLYRILEARGPAVPEEQLCWTDGSSGTCQLTDPMLESHNWFQVDFLYQGSWTSLWEVESTATPRSLPNAAQLVRWSILAGPPMDAIRVSTSPSLAPVDSRGELILITEVWIQHTQPSSEVAEPSACLTAFGGMILMAVYGKLRRAKA